MKRQKQLRAETKYYITLSEFVSIFTSPKYYIIKNGEVFYVRKQDGAMIRVYSWEEDDVKKIAKQVSKCELALMGL